MLTQAEVEELIIKRVTELQGCKATELVTFVTKDLIERESLITNVVNMIEDLVKAGKLVEVEYVLPTMTYRIKSFLLPAGTEVSR